MKGRKGKNRNTLRSIGYGIFGVLLSLGPAAIGRLAGGCPAGCAGCLRCLALVPLEITSSILLRKSKDKETLAERNRMGHDL